MRGLAHNRRPKMVGKTKSSRKRGKPNMRWMDSIKEVRDLSLQELSRAAEDRTWGTLFTHRISRYQGHLVAHTCSINIQWIFNQLSWAMAYLMYVSIPSICPVGSISTLFHLRWPGRFCFFQSRLINRTLSLLVPETFFSPSPSDGDSVAVSPGFPLFPLGFPYTYLHLDD